MSSERAVSVRDEAATAPQRGERYRRFARRLPGSAGGRRALLSILLGLAAWELVARFVVNNPAFLAAPSAVAVRFWQMLGDGEVLYHVSVSGQEFLLGFLLGSTAGILIGTLMAISQPVHDFLDPWISAMYAAPIIALAPLVILWFGIGIPSKVAVVFSLVVFPMVINTEAGVRSVDRHLIEMAQSFGARMPRVFTTVSLPGALPFIVSGLRIGVGRGLIGVVVGELFGARAGLGYLITNANQVFDMATLFVAVAILAAAGIVLTAALQRVERHLDAWREAS